MKIVILTSNARRHRYVANILAAEAEVLVISEAKNSDSSSQSGGDSLITKHFQERFAVEERFFQGHDSFHSPTLPIVYNEASQPFVADIVARYAPDAVFVFGASILKGELFSVVPPERFVNLHLGLSPYYRGAGTNFWPFVNDELQFVGATIHHLDSGIDTGDIIMHVRPVFTPEDTVHTVGCKTIEVAAAALARTVREIRAGAKLPRVRQQKVEKERSYTTRDFNVVALERYQKNLESGMVGRYCRHPLTPEGFALPFWES